MFLGVRRMLISKLRLLGNGPNYVDQAIQHPSLCATSSCTWRCKHPYILRKGVAKESYIGVKHDTIGKQRDLNPRPLLPKALKLLANGPNNVYYGIQQSIPLIFK